MSDKIKESLENLQKEYNQVAAELGHEVAQIHVKEDEIDALKKRKDDALARVESIIKKVKSIQANMPKEEAKEEIKEEKQNGES